MFRGIQCALILMSALAVAAPLPAQLRQADDAPPPSPVFQFNPQLGTGNASVPAAADGGPGGARGRDNIGVPNYLDGGRLLNTQVSPQSSGGSGQTSSSGDQRTGGFSSYPNYPTYDPIGSALQGIASLTTAYGQYGKDYQYARLLNQEVERSRIGTRMLLRQEELYRQSLQPKAEDLRRATLALDLARARKQAPLGEVLSGKSPNDLLAFLKGESAKGKRGPAAPLDETTLRDLNVTTDFGGNIGLIKSGKVTWPPILMDPVFGAAREKIDSTLKDAVERARINGKVDDVLLRDLDAALRRMDQTLDRVVTQMTITDYMGARRHLDWLGEGRRALADPNVVNYFNRRYEARGKTVADLIDHMSREGLRFAPAVAGGEGAYRALYTSLAAYADAVQPVKP